MVTEEAEIEMVVAKEVDEVWGKMVNVEKVTIVVEFVEVEVVAVKVEESTLTVEVRGGGGW